MRNIIVNKKEYEKYFNIIKKVKKLKETEDIKNYLNTIIKKIENEITKKPLTELEINSKSIFKIYFEILKDVILFFETSNKKEFESSWNNLQNAQVKLDNLFVIVANKEDFNLSLISSYLDNLEKVFPYKWFNSIEYTTDDKRCSICNKLIQDDTCLHISGEIYNGEVAHKIINNITELKAVALVNNPANTHCIINIPYVLDKFEISPFNSLFNLTSSLEPFMMFDLKKRRKIILKNNYKFFGNNILCPCGNRYHFKQCCYKKRQMVIENHSFEKLNQIVI